MARARVRKDTSAVTVQEQPASVPWVVRAAATLPRGVRISNPLLGDDPAGTIAVIDNAASPDLSLPELFSIAEKSDGALVVWEADETAQAEMRKHGFVPFFIDGCAQLFAANFDLPTAPWLRKSEIEVVAPVETTTRFRLHADGKETKHDVTVDSVSLLPMSANVIKSEDGAEERFVLGIVLEPDVVDSQGDTISASEIRQAAHRYMEEHANVGLQHQVFVNGKIKILESYIAPSDFKVGDELVKAGTWLMAFRVLDDSIWKAVKDGLLDGLSIGGTGLKIPVS